MTPTYLKEIVMAEVDLNAKMNEIQQKAQEFSVNILNLQDTLTRQNAVVSSEMAHNTQKANLIQGAMQDVKQTSRTN
ncbi:hypothetical protein D3C72_1573810 [compost metagenome]